MLFPDEDLEKVRRREKTMSRRISKRELTVGHIYPARRSWFEKPAFYILIIRKFREKLGDISFQDIQKEGYNSLDEFRIGWSKKVGRWDPDQIVTAYEFRRTENGARKPQPTRLNNHL